MDTVRQYYSEHIKELTADITYTYCLSEGVARNQNSTYLLKKILK